jgi:hypothetical protein
MWLRKVNLVLKSLRRRHNNFLSGRQRLTVKQIIDNWDPMGLFPWAPDDEYHSEIEEIEKILEYTNELNDLSVNIHSIFNKYFGNVFTGSINDCEIVAKKILARSVN